MVFCEKEDSDGYTFFLRHRALDRRAKAQNLTAKRDDFASSILTACISATSKARRYWLLGLEGACQRASERLGVFFFRFMVGLHGEGTVQHLAVGSISVLLLLFGHR